MDIIENWELSAMLLGVVVDRFGRTTCWRELLFTSSLKDMFQLLMPHQSGYNNAINLLCFALKNEPSCL